ncbi:MAG: hypothetical protein ACRYGA_02180 [Janthinobacterium lividum]
MKEAVLFLAILGVVGQVSAGYDNSCKVKSCKPGDIVKVYSPKGDEAPVCATRALHSYVAAVVGLRQIQARLGAKLSGEEEYKGETKAYVDHLRQEAGVSDFRQASQACSIGKHNQRVTIIEVDPREGQLRVAPVNGNAQFWIWDVSLER